MTDPSRVRFAAIAVGTTSFGLLAAAFAFQYLGGLVPCPLCLVQRWTHVAVLLACAGALARPGRVTLTLGLLASFAAIGTAGFHAGVEQGWWEGLASCSGAAENMSGMSGADLLSTAAPAPIIKCSEIAWSRMGLSMAGWNAVVSALAAVAWIKAPALRRR